MMILQSRMLKDNRSSTVPEYIDLQAGSSGLWNYRLEPMKTCSWLWHRRVNRIMLTSPLIGHVIRYQLSNTAVITTALLRWLNSWGSWTSDKIIWNVECSVINYCRPDWLATIVRDYVTSEHFREVAKERKTNKQLEALPDAENIFTATVHIFRHWLNDLWDPHSAKALKSRWLLWKIQHKQAGLPTTKDIQAFVGNERWNASVLCSLTKVSKLESPVLRGYSKRCHSSMADAERVESCGIPRGGWC